MKYCPSHNFRKEVCIMKNYAVIFEYSFDDEISVYLFETEEQAKKFLKESFEEEVRIDREENGWDTNASIDEDGWAAYIFNRFEDRIDTIYMKIGNIYQQKKGV